MEDAESVIAAAAQLPENERVHIIETLLESLEPHTTDDPQDVTKAWRQELQRRSNEMRTGTVKPVPWSDVRLEGR